MITARRWRPTIGLKLGLLTGALVAVLVISSGVLIGQVAGTAAQYDAILATEVHQGLLARRMQVEFKTQVQDWKDILLRGSNPPDMAEYTAGFDQESHTVAVLYGQLMASSPSPELKAGLEQFHQLLLQADAGYAKALPGFVASGGVDFKAADRQVRGIDRPVSAQLDTSVAALETRIAAKVSGQNAATAAGQRTTLICAAGLLIALVLALAFALLRIVRPIRKLTREAFRSASDRLPGAIAAVRAMAPGAQPPTLPPFRVDTQDELRDLGEALTTLQDSALALAAQQHRTERETADMLINLGRRNQNLLGRMLSYVTALERREQDPEILSQLFQLDHATTRIRRNAESMLVLAGAQQTRTWSRPVPCIDVVRGALSEIEEYVRVDLHHIEDGAVTGTAVADVVHLIAELVENATHFSPPNTQVTVIGQRIRDGYRLRVIDQGVGMTRRELDQANQRIASVEGGWSDARLLGLYVVGRLARRRSIGVSLEPSAGRGITATVLLPIELLASVVEAGSPGAALSRATGRREPAPALWSGGVPDHSGPVIDLAAFDDTVGSGVPAGVPSQWSTDLWSPAGPPMRPATFAPPAALAAPALPAPAAAPASPAAVIPRRVRGAQLPDLGPDADLVPAGSDPPAVEPESQRWQLRSFQLDVAAARRALAEASTTDALPASTQDRDGAGRGGRDADAGSDFSAQQDTRQDPIHGHPESE
jgi:anti-sigma regulatory factor (Ser/Thr protein kinase)